MNSSIVNNVLRFVFLILLQVLVLNNINFLGYINPYLYVLFLLLFPFTGNQTLFIFCAFLLGLSIDIFEDSGGINAAACLVAAFVRPNLLRFSFGVSYDHQNIRLANTPFGAKLSYISLMVLIHHFVLFLGNVQRKSYNIDPEKKNVIFRNIYRHFDIIESYTFHQEI